ncbi:MAG: hypothetical protein KC731_36630 [Myxococcales bacterium]|nr:hypothetical protein [Myxococcales bacterium]
MTQPHTIRQLLDQLTEQRDAMRVQLHLAGMDLKREWDHVEDRLRAIGDVEELRDEARLRMHLAKMDAKDELDPLIRSIDAMVDGVEREREQVSKEVHEGLKALAAKLRALVAHGKTPDEPS